MAAAGGAGQRFGKNRRLLTERGFRFVFKRPWQSRGDGLRFYARPNDGDCDRLGIAVSRKVDANAAGRNRIKRQVREFFRRHSEGEGNIGDRCVDLVVVAQKPCAAMDNAAIRDEIRRHWRRLVRRYHRRSALPGGHSVT